MPDGIDIRLLLLWLPRREKLSDGRARTLRYRLMFVVVAASGFCAFSDATLGVIVRIDTVTVVIGDGGIGGLSLRHH